jgi:membrane associated rhomboid family serine protease/Zn-finger nucleic acid-binding protein
MHAYQHGHGHSHASHHRHPTGRYCARCTYPLHHLPAGSVWIDHCYRCGGSFLDQGKAGQAIGSHADPSKWGAEVFARPPMPSPLLCPSGHGRMWSYLLRSEGKEVELDSCVTCRGLWLDAREAEVLAKISAEAEADAALPGASHGKLGVAAMYALQLVTMLPIEVRAPVKTKPWLVWFLLVICAVIYGVEIKLGAAGHIEPAIRMFGVVPSDVLAGKNVFSLVTHAFLHGGLLHLVGNAYSLWIFGDNVEDRLGRLRFAILYLVSAVAGGLFYVAVKHGSDGVMVGASGAIAGLMGAYLVLFPRVKLWMVLFFVPLRMPAWIYMIIWLVFQGAIIANPKSNVAWQAHVGGFVAGVALAYLLRPKQVVDAPPGGVPAPAAT